MPFFTHHVTQYHAVNCLNELPCDRCVKQLLTRADLLSALAFFCVSPDTFELFCVLLSL